jgi:hypothetical protein
MRTSQAVFLKLTTATAPIVILMTSLYLGATGSNCQCLNKTILWDRHIVQREHEQEECNEFDPPVHDCGNCSALCARGSTFRAKTEIDISAASQWDARSKARKGALSRKQLAFKRKYGRNTLEAAPTVRYSTLPYCRWRPDIRVDSPCDPQAFWGANLWLVNPTVAPGM